MLSWTRGGQTLGARAWRVRVVRADGARLTVANALARFALGWLSLLVLGLGFLWSLIDAQSRGWHDLGSGTQLLVTTDGGNNTSTNQVSISGHFVDVP